ncbi:MAG: hypothetical protein KJO01_03025 [Gammaproteobacteria bacterium]|nr:hypothetical protein [Gammaproteobacteria bacterium]MBT8111239.1 hypothetical protein [Gammaproteobacteria bacterium]NND47644.1 hypothetical protein [Woeseiaceae bacterium]NNL45937.1 hypothetical protein [Woeseiaceae bacterium]
MLVKYLLVWLVLAVVATANGIIRQITYGKIVSDLTAHQISTITAILATGGVAWMANQFWSIESSAQAWAIGLLWLILTVIFEFGFGHYVVGHPWQKLFADYKIFDGRVWSLFLIWVLIIPLVVFKLSTKLQ